jgi:hypothetical protein
VKIATNYDTNLPPEKIKAATRNEQFFVFSSPAVDPYLPVGYDFTLP